MRLTRQSLIIGTVVLSLVVCALAWFLLISPKRDEAQATRDETANLESSNDVLAVSVVDLREKFARLDEYKAELAAAQTKVPQDLVIASVVLEVETAAVANGVVLAELSPSDGQVVRSGALATPSDATAPASTDEAGGGPTEADGLVAYPVSMTVYGSYDETTAFVSQIQTMTERYVLVTGTQIEATVEAPALPDGTPDLEPGDMKTIVNAYVYALPSAEPAATPDDAEPVPLPVRPEGKSIVLPQPVAGG